MSSADDKNKSQNQLPPQKQPIKKIVIEGITQQGKTFRPSDWAERMSGTLATFKNRRIYYSPLLQPTTHVEGYKCILLDPKLKESSPQVYQSILDFANANQLRICNEESANETSTIASPIGTPAKEVSANEKSQKDTKDKKNET